MPARYWQILTPFTLNRPPGEPFVPDYICRSIRWVKFPSSSTETLYWLKALPSQFILATKFHNQTHTTTAVKKSADWSINFYPPTNLSTGWQLQGHFFEDPKGSQAKERHQRKLAPSRKQQMFKVVCLLQKQIRKFFLIFKWVDKVAKESGYPGTISNSLYYLSEFSILLYGITIGTIDEKSTGKLHGPCAVIFFVVLIISIVVITLYLTNLREYDTRAIGLKSLRIKQILTVYLLAVWAYCVVMLILVSSQEGFEDLEGKGDKYVVIVEWNTVTIGLLWVLTWYFEWENYYLCLIPTKKANFDENEGKNVIKLNKNSQPACKEFPYGVRL